MNKIKLNITLLAILFIFTPLNAKDSTGVSTKFKIAERIIWGGFVTIQVGTITLISVSPEVGFVFSPRLISGLGISYQYYSQKWYADRISSSIYAGRVYSQYLFYRYQSTTKKKGNNFSLFTHIEYEVLNLDRDFSNPNMEQQSDRFWTHGILLGPGFKQIFGKRSSLNITLLYNFLRDNRTPYDNPQIRVGIYF